MLVFIQIYVTIYIVYKDALWAPKALVGRALVGAPGPLWAVPLWAHVCQALVGPLGPCGPGPCGPPMGPHGLGHNRPFWETYI